MTSQWSAPRGVTPETSRLLVERAHEEIIAGNLGDARLLDVRELVRESWRRSLASAVGAEDLPPLEFTREAIEAYRRDHPLAGARDMIRALLIPGDAASSGVVVAVGDAAGRLLWVEGDHGIQTLTSDMGFVAGANWSEQKVGTSAPGTALQLGQSVQIQGAEHFNRFVQPWSCTAAPVRDPETREILGVIDVTGGVEAVTPQAQLLVDATARAVESELLVARLRQRAEPQAPVTTPRRAPAKTARASLRVLGQERAYLAVEGEGVATHTPLGARHAEILLMLVVNRQGLSAERLTELVYGEGASIDTLRPEMVRLRKFLARVAPFVELESRPYRLKPALESDAHHVLSLLDRGAHRVALAAYTGDVLTGSVSPGVEDFRNTVRTALREALIAEASVEVLLEYADTEAGQDDLEVLQLALELLPARSPKRSMLVSRIERLA
ncbi:GAF domain-containing protein [Microbacterium sp. YY-03]|uniref:GAF domain-containing protein n=1 Tax=Microbacterium sp. YY-03 TaxID=3421636 RepID=UPI003D176C9C